MTSQFQNRAKGWNDVRNFSSGRSSSSDYLSQLDAMLFMTSFTTVAPFGRNQVGGIRPYKHDKSKTPKIVAVSVRERTGAMVRHVYHKLENENGREIYYVLTDEGSYMATVRKNGSKVLQVRKVL